jgi:SAM-dependent methyltransferase
LRLLDYGCGRGVLLGVSLEFGLQPEGVEADAVARAIAAKASGREIHESLDELESSNPNPNFDLIILWTVIEHLRNPWAELARLRNLIRPGGWLLLSTMDIRCLRARLETKKWENYENPTHLYYFDRQSLSRAIRAAGFSEFSEWKLRLRHAHHGTLRRWLYNISFWMGWADGLYFLCRRSNRESAENRLSSASVGNTSQSSTRKSDDEPVNCVPSQTQPGLR